MLEDPTLPIHKLMPTGAQTGLIVLTGLGAVAIWLYAITESRRRKDLVPVLIVAGAGLSVFYEPLGDAMAKVYYTENGQHRWINAFGRDIPVFIGLLYFWYMSVGAMWLLRASKRGVTARQWWTCWSGYLAFALTLEMVAANGLANADGAPWIYYGKQAFVVLDVPIFTPWTYVSIDVAIAAGVVTMARYLPLRQHWLLLPCVPMLMLAGHAMTALPSSLALNSTDHGLLLHLGALGSAAFALILSHVCSLPFRRPWGPDRAELDRLEHQIAAALDDARRAPVAAVPAPASTS
jgi:hypothetical protein